MMVLEERLRRYARRYATGDEVEAYGAMLNVPVGQLLAVQIVSNSIPGIDVYVSNTTVAMPYMSE